MYAVDWLMELNKWTLYQQGCIFILAFIILRTPDTNDHDYNYIQCNVTEYKKKEKNWKQKTNTQLCLLQLKYLKENKANKLLY